MKTYTAGLLDRVPFPTHLTATVVEPTQDPRVHGYAVQADLGHNVAFVDLGWLALTGALPTEHERAALSQALIWLAPLHVGEGPAHAGVLAKVAGAPDEVLPAIATVALGQWIAAELHALAPLFAWLGAPLGDPPACAIEAAPTEAQREAHARLTASSERWFGADRALPAAPVLTRVAAGYALLHRLGMHDAARLHAFATWARLPLILAEAACATSGAVMQYPGDLPPYRYVEEESA